MHGKRRLMLLGPALMAALAFPQTASDASTASDVTQTATGIQRTVTAPTQGAYDRGYARGLRAGRRDGRNDCSRSGYVSGRRGSYWRGWRAGYEEGYSRYCG